MSTLLPVRTRLRLLALAWALALEASCAGLAARPGETRVPPGAWGGDHVALTVTDAGGHVEFDCAHGDLTEPLSVDNTGRWAVKGTYARERGGPVRQGDEQTSRPARYSGRLEGDSLQLTVALADTSETVGTFALKRGAAGNVHKCR